MRKRFRCILPTKRHIKERFSNVNDKVKWIKDYYELPIEKIDSPYYGGWYFKFDVGDIIELCDTNWYDYTSFDIIIQNSKGRMFYPNFTGEFGNYQNSEWVKNHFIEIN